MGEVTRSGCFTAGARKQGPHKQLSGEVKEMENYLAILMGAFQQHRAISPASPSNRKLPPSFMVLLLANVHKFWSFGPDLYAVR